MSWCDKLASTPAVGLRLSPQYKSGGSLLDALSPLFNSWGDENKSRFTLERAEAFAIEATTEDGFKYVVEPNRIVVDFQHRLKMKPVSGGPPTVELLSKALPYTTLLPEVCARILMASELVVGTESRLLERVGIVTTSTVSEEEMPPGVRRFLSYVARPWGSSLDHYQIVVTSEIERNDDWHDRCIHQISKSEDSEALPVIKFDWQRVFTKPKELTTTALKPVLVSAQENALEYFEQLAEGNRFDDELIGKAN